MHGCKICTGEDKNQGKNNFFVVLQVQLQGERITPQ